MPRNQSTRFGGRDDEVPILSRDFWLKVVGMLQQNWALIDSTEEGAVVWFLDDASGVYDSLPFASVADAERALRRNRFCRYSDDAEAQRFIALPSPPFRKARHVSGPIYSSGRSWKSED